MAKADQLRRLREQESVFRNIYDAVAAQRESLAAEGRRPVLGGLLSKEPVQGTDTLRYEGIGNMLMGLLAPAAKAIDAPASAARQTIPRQDMAGEALGTAGMAMLGGGAVARPANSLGSNSYGNTVDFNAFKKARAKEDFLGKVNAVVDDVSSGAYQARIDQSAFNLHKSGNLPLPVGTRVSPPSSYEMGNDLRISGYWVDPQDANVFGYKLQNDAGEEFREFVNNPRLGIGSRSADRFGGGFKAFAGPNADDRFGFSAPSSSFTQTAAREPIPDSVQKEYDALFGNPLMRAKDGDVAADVAERGDTILNMLKSGQADNITDAMLDMGDSVKNTQLNQYLFQNYDLPMDEASRMARAQEMGLLDDAHHATDAEFQQFIPSQVGRHGAGVYTGKNAPDVQTFLPKDEETRRYAEGSQVLPLRIPDDAQMASEIKWQDALPERWNYGDPKDVTDAISGYAEAADTLSQAGFKGVVQPATDWDGRVILDPTNIRSRFARFDPRLSHLSNLTAANMSPIGGLLAQGVVSQEEIEDYLRQKGLLD